MNKIRELTSQSIPLEYYITFIKLNNRISNKLKNFISFDLLFF